MQCEFSIQPFARLNSSFPRHGARCHEEQVDLCFFRCDLATHSVDISKKRYIYLNKGGLGRRVEGQNGRNGIVGGGLTSADEVDLRGVGATGEC